MLSSLRMTAPFGRRIIKKISDLVNQFGKRCAFAKLGCVKGGVFFVGGIWGKPYGHIL